MPTGYTAAVVDGKVTTLRDFALTCARGMGALIMMRDDPWDAPIPERFEPGDYYAKSLAEVQAELAALRAMHPTEWQAAADAEFAAAQKAKAEYLADKETQRARYDAMIAQVEPWTGAPEGLKGFMLDQLYRGRDFDCPEDTSYWKEPEQLTGEEWKAKREADLMQSGAKYAEEHQKEVDRTESRNAWIKTLFAALPADNAPVAE